MKKIIYITYSFLLLSALMLTSCKKKEQVVSPPTPGNEFMTTVKIRFQNAANAADTSWAIWKDLTPDDNTPPDTSLAIVNLKKSSTYHASVHFYDETKSPASDLTSEILTRANYHSYWFFKTGAAASHFTVTATDHDTNSPPLPIGLADDFVTDSVVVSGRLEGVLRHQPNSKNGTFAPGSTDSDVFFRINIIN
jgi:hypothetical protein